MTTRQVAFVSLLAALVSLLGLLVGLGDPEYYAPETTLDYASAALNSLGPLVAALAMLVWWRVMPLGRRALLIPIAATGAVLFGLGNFLEDIAGLGVGEDLYFFGGAAFFAVSVVAGVIVLTAPHRLRGRTGAGT